MSSIVLEVESEDDMPPSAVAKGGMELLMLSPAVQSQVEAFAASHTLDAKAQSAIEEAGDAIATRLCSQELKPTIRNKSAYLQKAVRNAVEEEAWKTQEGEQELEQEQEATEEQEQEQEATPEQEAYAEGYA